MDIRQFVGLVDVENNFCFLPRDGLTFCNCYAKVVLASQGVFIPNMAANDLYDWVSASKEWTQDGKTNHDAVIAIAKHTPHGHIAVAVQEGNGIWTSAGARNRKFCTGPQAFGSLTPTVFYHVK